MRIHNLNFCWGGLFVRGGYQCAIERSNLFSGGIKVKAKMKSSKVLFCLSVILIVAVFALYVQAGSLEPSSPPGPTMKSLDEVEPRTAIHTTDLPMTITQSGSYYLTQSIHYNGSGDGITIECNDVSVDLRGFCLFASGSGGAGASGSGVYAAAGRNRISVFNGSVVGWGDYGIYLAGNSNQLRQIKVSGSGKDGIRVGANCAIADCAARLNGKIGIHTDATCVITGCIGSTNSDDGIVAGGGSSIENSAAKGNTDCGIAVGNESSIVGCTALGNGGRGISAGFGSMVSGCSSCNNGGAGFYCKGGSMVLRGGVVSKCIGSGNTGNGLVLGIHGTAEGCSFFYDANGISATSYCVIRNCTVGSNGTGIAADTADTIENCEVSGNSYDGIKVASCCKVVGNNCCYNGQGPSEGAGVHATGGGSRIEANNVLHNDRGIDVDGANNFIVKNSASSNTNDYDIAAGNKVGPVCSDPNTQSNPWANFQF